MSAHTITAGHGYKYLTSQTMAQDSSLIPAGGLGAYYSERGESPGRWLGAGLDGLGIAAGSRVSEAQMVALFGEGRHPDADAMAARLSGEGAGLHVVDAATALGRPFALNLANSEYARQVAQLMGEWNREQGQPACAPVPEWMRARIRTAVGRSLFADEHGREPDARELSGFIARQSRLGSKAVGGFDLTFSPVKSVSALWALAPAHVAEQIAAAHEVAVRDTIGWLEEKAAYTRLGRNGVRQVDVRGLVAAAFVHRSSRAGDPDLHTHVAVSNKVQTLDGRWRALDGRVLLKATVAASERYNTRLEAELRARLGVRFVEQERPGRRAVREIAGMDQRLLQLWSTRRNAIDVQQATLSAAFQGEHGRPPTPVESLALAQQATLATRPAKHEPQAEVEQRAAWQAQAIAVLTESGLVAMVGDVLAAASVPVAPVSVLTSDRVREVGQLIVDRVQADRATWQRWHILAEAQRELRRLEVPLDELDATLGAVVEAALSVYSITLPRPDELALLVEPELLRRADGSSVYTVAGSQLFTSRAVLAAEQSLLDAAARTDGRRVGAGDIEMALLEATANGLNLNDGQVAFVRELAGSGARCQLALAPAGTGKTTALQVLSRAWTESGGRIVALATSAAAARQLADATGAPADTLAKALHDLDHERLALNAGTLVVVDEAGMASTPDLARLTAHALASGASVRLVGDDRQLAAIGAGGILRDLAETIGAVSLAIAVRFTNPEEADGALAIRDGESAALDFYLDHGRVRVGDEHTAPMSAYDAWAADRAAGHDALLLAATRDHVTALNARARSDRLAATGSKHAAHVALADGTAASAGDLIITRRNERRLGITATDWVKNGDRFTVHTVHDSGAVTAVHRATGRHVQLPASYVADHVALGYATTIHAAQGSTAYTCHTVITGSETRAQLYVALSRGRAANYLHVALPGAGDEHAVIRRDSLIPPSATDLLRRVLNRESIAGSATTEARTAGDPANRLREAVDRYSDSLTRAPLSDGRPAGPAPLPWLPPRPDCTDETWRSYLAARADQIRDLADQIAAPAYRHNRGALLNRMDPWLMRDLTLWRTTHPDTDIKTVSAPDRLTRREESYRAHLQQRLDAIGARGARWLDDNRRWAPLVAAVEPSALESANYPALARELTAMFRAGLDVDRLFAPVCAEKRTHPDVIAALAELTARRQEAKDAAAREQTTRNRRAPTHSPSFGRARRYEPPGL